MTGPDCMCKMSCFSKIPEEQKQYFISYFNSIADKSKQDTFLAGLIETHKVQRHRSRLGERPPKTCSAKYKVKFNSTTLYICRKAFGSIFDVSKHVTDRIVQKVINNDFSPKDGRGKHNNRPNVNSQLIRSQIDTHINSFPARQSHYSRLKNGDTKYLSSDLSVATIYRLYLQKYEPIYWAAYSKGEAGMPKPIV